MSRTLSTEQGRDKMHVLRGTSAEMHSKLADCSLDFVYIDGDHTLKGCLMDLMFWYDKVADGGLICGDDFEDRGDKAYAATHVKSVVLAMANLIGAKVRDVGARQFGFIKPAGPTPEQLAAKVLNTLRSSKKIPDLTDADIDAAESAMRELKLIY
ncbi:unnamed protein product [Prorocentrum cordatum]|uniref:Class I SAM-dependent methyltransferase n=1 Tax=Prorocentrum cordatum TaxID=2364126 RepID=A0ABN9Y404_9DINO|nr:unnamed protein product [Polarella glacialis]